MDYCYQLEGLYCYQRRIVDPKVVMSNGSTQGLEADGCNLRSPRTKNYLPILVSSMQCALFRSSRKLPVLVMFLSSRGFQASPQGHILVV